MKTEYWTYKKAYNVVKEYYPDVWIRAVYKNGYDMICVESPLGVLRKTIPFKIYDRFLKKLCVGVSLVYYERLMKPKDNFLEIENKL